MLNKVIIMGRCGRDPEMRMTPSGVPVTSVTLAVDRDFGKDGNKETDWIDVVAWRETAKFLADHFSKGRMAVVSGRLQIRKWNDKDGNKRSTAEGVADNVYFGDSKKDDTGSNSYSGNYGGYTAPALPEYPTTPASDFAMLDDSDAQLPF